VTLGCGGAVLWKRIIAAMACGAAVGLLYTGARAMLGSSGVGSENLVAGCVWRIFVFTILSAVGAIAAELKLRGPDWER
jgi:hypothetical protein